MNTRYNDIPTTFQRRYNDISQRCLYCCNQSSGSGPKNWKVLIFSLFLHENICYRYSLEAPHQYLLQMIPLLSGAICGESFTRRMTCSITLRKHAYSNIWKILQPKKETFQTKKSDIFQISAQNINYGYSLEPPRRGGSNEYAQYMFFSKIRKIMYTPVNPNFTI